jgi:hypothetical protein
MKGKFGGLEVWKFGRRKFRVVCMRLEVKGKRLKVKVRGWKVVS